jgi:hypothetical protein
MRDPELVARAQHAATRLETAWEQWRGSHGLALAPAQPVVSYVGYSLKEPWDEPRVVIGIDANEAEYLADYLDRDECAKRAQVAQAAQVTQAAQAAQQQARLAEPPPQEGNGEHAAAPLVSPVTYSGVRHSPDQATAMASGWTPGEVPAQVGQGVQVAQATEQLAAWPQGAPAAAADQPPAST